jgi:tRNA G18 (ribose-2'-O)-methylase SpoU
MKAAIVIGHLNNHGNEGTLIRTAEAFGINHVFVIGKREKEYGTSQGADQHVTFTEFETIDDLIEYCKTNNHHLVCAENIQNSIEIGELTPEKKTWPVNPVFVTGNEANGVPEAIIKQSDLVVRIDHGFGYVNCLNTSVALSIIIHAFYQYRKKRREIKWGDS